MKFSVAYISTLCSFYFTSKIEKLERKGRCDLIYHEVKNLGYGKKSRKGMWLNEDENNEITDKQGILNT